MSSDSDYDENPSEHQSENEENGEQQEETASAEIPNGKDEKPVTWNDLVRECDFLVEI